MDKHEQRLLPGRAGLHARAGEALGPFDVARLSERTDEHRSWSCACMRCMMPGDKTDGGRQSSPSPSQWWLQVCCVAHIHTSRFGSFVVCVRVLCVLIEGATIVLRPTTGHRRSGAFAVRS